MLVLKAVGCDQNRFVFVVNILRIRHIVLLLIVVITIVFFRCDINDQRWNSSSNLFNYWYEEKKNCVSA